MSEIQCIIELIFFFQINGLTFVASEFKILFLECTDIHNLICNSALLF